MWEASVPAGPSLKASLHDLSPSGFIIQSSKFNMLIIATSTEKLLCEGHCSKNFVYINLFTPHNRKCKRYYYYPPTTNTI